MKVMTYEASKRPRPKVLTPSTIFTNIWSLYISYLYDGIFYRKKFRLSNPSKCWVLGQTVPTCLPLVCMYSLTKLHYARNIIIFIRLPTLQHREPCLTLNRENISLSQSVIIYCILSSPGNTSECQVAELP